MKWICWENQRLRPAGHSAGGLCALLRCFVSCGCCVAIHSSLQKHRGHSTAVSEATPGPKAVGMVREMGRGSQVAPPTGGVRARDWGQRLLEEKPRREACRHPFTVPRSTLLSAFIHSVFHSLSFMQTHSLIYLLFIHLPPTYHSFIILYPFPRHSVSPQSTAAQDESDPSLPTFQRLVVWGWGQLGHLFDPWGSSHGPGVRGWARLWAARLCGPGHGHFLGDCQARGLLPWMPGVQRKCGPDPSSFLSEPWGPLRSPLWSLPVHYLGPQVQGQSHHHPHSLPCAQPGACHTGSVTVCQ